MCAPSTSNGSKITGSQQLTAPVAAAVAGTDIEVVEGMPYASDEQLFPVWREPRSIWEKTGLSRGQERLLDIALVGLLLLFTAGWLYTAVTTMEEGGSPRIARQIGSSGAPLSGRSSDATFALAAMLERFAAWEEVRGASGEVQVVFRSPGDSLTLPDSVPAGLAVEYLPAGSDTTAAEAAMAGSAPSDRPGIWNVLFRISDAVQAVPNLSVITMVPSAELDEGYLGEYRVGLWPDESGVYAPPQGLVEVTPENMDTRVSKHFQLKDFLTKGQSDVWPKYVVLSPRLLDKLELTLQQLEKDGHPVEDVFVISGFRTPWYNRAGGNTQGRGSLSRHMYGDASDIAIDNNGDACMDDLTGDGRATVEDARVIAAAAEQVEKDHPELIGGIGIYAPVPGSHCGMVHIDTRGHRARW